MSARLRRWLALAMLVHTLIFAAGLLAPYDPRTQDREHSYAPPMRVHVRDASGTWHRPFVHPLVETSAGVYAEDRTRRLPLRLLVRDAPDPRSGVVRSRLFGTDPPARVYLLGTDALGRDLLSRTLHAARLSLAAGLLATGITMLLAFAFGALAGYAGGAVDRAIMFGADLLMALPWVYLLLAARSVLPLDLEPTRAFTGIVVLLALVGWARPARLIRGEVRLARHATFVTAARALGASPWRILSRHVLPAATGVAATQAALLVPQFVLAEVTLSFLGLGIAEPAPSWGGLLAAVQRFDVLRTAWWLLPPVLTLVPVCYIYYALADALHQRFGLPPSS